MRKSIEDYSDAPLYNMKAVEQLTGISAATLRAWERRYRLLTPKRTQTGYRLYSERDVALLRWVRNQMNDGLTVSRVVAMLHDRHANEEPIYSDSSPDAPVVPTEFPPLSPADMVGPLYEALINLDDDHADELMEQAHAMYSLATVYIEIISPTLVQIGDAWQRGNLLITIEHFASNYVCGRLLALFQAYPQRGDMPMIFVGCAPGERHAIGALIFAVMLRQQGYKVVFLGHDLPLDDVVKTAYQEHPTMICLSATAEATAIPLGTMQELLNKGKPPLTMFGYGGSAFEQNPELRHSIPGYYLGSDPRDAVNMVNNLIRSQRSV